MEESVVSKSNPGPEALGGQLDQLEKDLAGGLQFTNMLTSINQEKITEQSVLLNSLVELLISKGIIHVHELEQRKKGVAESLSKEERLPSVQLIDAPDKYSNNHDVKVDCAERLPICKGACCKLWFALSVQDLAEGVVKWNYSLPYGIAQEPDGYCRHFDKANCQCAIYENRPLVCRGYSCAEDKRIWLDFEKKILNPELRF